ncbi:glycerol-3-phosphate responsive antiterminator [Cutibacterium modestum]|uniref:Glycerol-3-phosphate responsive antiterminator n=1 Tax=Cutibacterium modestum TaxID=2559073 RepID=A0AAD1KPW8_9ACTN|nr:glycerol-3-phosphate responsive antiterminator [Cutibacterium modestum]BCY25459.1 hypothetical protein KB1_14490 [Cutibacterium modestum]
MEKLRTDAVEILPGPMAKGAYQSVRSTDPKRTVIAGGFIRSQTMVNDLFSAGFDAVTTSFRPLW